MAKASERKLQLSPTRIATFLACRVMYKYDYIDKIGKFYHKSRAGNSFGATLHQALQQFHEAGGSAVETLDDLTARTISAWRPAGFVDTVDEEAHKQLAVELMTMYHASDIKRAGQTQVFLSEKMLKLDMGSFVLTGRVDRIDEHLDDGTLEIIDYKSGRLEITEEQVRSALAMSIYQLLAKRIYPERRVFATIISLRTGTSASAELSDDELNSWEDEIKDVARQIVETDWESLRPVYLEQTCPSCDFLNRCQRYFKAANSPF